MLLPVKCILIQETHWWRGVTFWPFTSICPGSCWLQTLLGKLIQLILGCHCQPGMQCDHFHGGELYNIVLYCTVPLHGNDHIAVLWKILICMQSKVLPSVRISPKVYRKKQWRSLQQWSVKGHRRCKNAMMPVTKHAQEGRPFPKQATAEVSPGRLPASQERSLLAPLILYLLQWDCLCIQKWHQPRRISLSLACIQDWVYKQPWKTAYFRDLWPLRKEQVSHFKVDI